MVVDGVAVPDLVDLSLAHHRDVVGHRQGLALIVGDVDERDSDTLLDGAELRAHVLAELQIERRQRLVEQQHVRFGRERPGDGNALALSPRQLVAHLFALVGQRDQIEQLLGPPAALGAPQAAHLEGERDVLPHRHEREECEVLEDEGGGPLVRTNPRHVPAADPHHALRGLQEAGYGAQQSGLAAPRRSEEAEEPAFGDVDAHVPGGDEIAEPDPHAVELDPGAHRVLSVMAFPLRLPRCRGMRAGSFGHAAGIVPRVGASLPTSRSIAPWLYTRTPAQSGSGSGAVVAAGQALTNLLRYSVRTSAYHCGSFGQGHRFASESPGYTDAKTSAY